MAFLAAATKWLFQESLKFKPIGILLPISYQGQCHYRNQVLAIGINSEASASLTIACEALSKAPSMPKKIQIETSLCSRL